MNPKEYLRQIKKCDNQINNKLAEVARLRQIATSITSTLQGEVVRSGSSGRSPVAEAVDKIVDLENEINTDIGKFIRLKREIMSVIDQIDGVERDVLYKRYMQFETWEQIACEMGFTYQWVCKLHGRGLEKVRTICSDS